MNIWDTILKCYDNKIVIVNNQNCKLQVCVQHNTYETEAEIYIYIFVWNRKRLNLLATYYGRENRIKIADIQVDKANRNQGLGTIALKNLFEIGKTLGVTRYTGFLSDDDINDDEDLEHRERLMHFYTKFGFVIDIINKHIEKNIAFEQE